MENKDLLTQDHPDGALIFDVSQRSGGQYGLSDNPLVTVIRLLPEDPCALVKPDAQYPDVFEKWQFAALGTNPDSFGVQNEERRFRAEFNQIIAQKRTIGAMTILVFVFDDSSVRIPIVQRSATSQTKGTSGLGQLSRFGGGASGGNKGTGVHGPLNLANQAARELLEECHLYLRSGENRLLTPINIIPEGHEIDGSKQAFMRAALDVREGLSKIVNSKLGTDGYQIGQIETVSAKALVVPGLSTPVVQLIDETPLIHKNTHFFDLQPVSKNMDATLDFLYAIRLQGVRPEDLIFKDGEGDLRSGRMLDRFIFLADTNLLKRAADGEHVPLYPGHDTTNPANFFPAFRPTLQNADKIAQAALERVF